jgi:hypothetical protein
MKLVLLLAAAFGVSLITVKLAIEFVGGKVGAYLPVLQE